MKYRILGPLEVVDDDGDQIDLGSRQQRALLAMFLLNLNRVVSTDRILEEFWPDDPDGKEKTLWVYISRLRGILEPNREARAKSEVLVTRDHGYSLVADPSDLDAHRFESALEQARSELLDDPAAALMQLDEALSVWRGSALEDFAYNDFAQADAARFEEARLGALEDRIDAQLRLGRHREVIGEVDSLVRDQPLRERLVGLQMLALYRSGRQADALRAFERYRTAVGEELGIEPSPELRLLEEQVLLHDSRLTPASVRAAVDPRPAVDAVNPFKGLQSFAEADVATFFGRDRLISDMVRRIAGGNRLLALVGASGSGKSSVVKAGLIPAIRKGAIEGSERWLIAQMVPGSRPFTEVEAALLRSSLDAPESLASLLNDPEDGLLRACLRLLPDEKGRLLLVIDQFEELFTLVASDEERDRFIRNLEMVLNDPRGRVVVAITLRADFYARPLEYPKFGRLLGEGIVNTGPLTPDELEAAAEEPAAHAGVELEPALVVTLLTDVAGQIGGLPLFQYALTELFDRRSGTMLTKAAYDEMGGVSGALARRAEDLFLELGPDERAAAKQLFLRLVTTAGDASWARRRVHGSEIVTIAADVIALREVLDRFSRHRLITFDRDAVSGSPTVEVAHEALLQEWPRLREWIEEGRDDVVRHARLSAALTEWKASGEKTDYLLSGDRLRDYEDWASLSTLLLTTEEDRYLDASIVQREAERVAEEERAAREQKLDRQARGRLRGLAIGGALVVAAVIVGVAILLVTRPPTIAVLHTGEGDQGINDMMVAGALLAENRLEVPVQVLPILSDHETRLRDLAETGAELVIVGSEFDVEVERVAPDYPDTHFVALDPTVLHIESDNLTKVHFDVEQSAYVAGVAAGLVSETGRVGFIGATQAFPTESSRNGFEQGVFESRPDVEVVSMYLGPTLTAANRPDLAFELATQMFASGVDVIFHDAGRSGIGVIQAAAELSDSSRHLWAIGSDADEYRSVPESYRDHVLTSTIKKFDAAVEDVIRAHLADALESGERRLGMFDGALELSRSGGHLDDVDGSLRWYEGEAGHLGISPYASRHPSWQSEPDVVVQMTLFDDHCRIDATSGDVEIEDGQLRLERGSVIETVLTNRTDDIGGISYRTIPSAITLAQLSEEAQVGIPESFDVTLGITLVEVGGTTSTAAEVDGQVFGINCIRHLPVESRGDYPTLIVRPAA